MVLSKFAGRPMRPVVVGVVAAISATAAAGPVFVESTWNLGANGNWHVAGNWAPATIPNNGGGNIYNVTIDGMRSDVTVNLNLSATIADLTITTGDALVINNGVNLNVNGGDVLNAGLIDWGGAASLTRMIILVDTVLSGGGTLALGAVNDRLDAGGGTPRLTNVDNLIQGGGQVGVNLLSLTNQSVIEANMPALNLTLDAPTGGDFTNQGTMRAVGGATLVLNAGDYFNAGGLIEAQDLSQVSFISSANIVGGELATLGSGVVRVTSGTVGLTDVANTGNLRLANGTLASVAGSMVNEATVTLDGTGSLTRYNILGDVMLTGGGTISLNANLNNRVDASATLDRLTNVDNTIQGGGQVGVNTMSFTNHALVDANIPGVTMTLDPPTSGDFTNDGTLRASGGGVLALTTGSYFNDLGVIEALNGSTVNLMGGASIVDGELTTDGTGVAVVVSGAAGVTDVINSGDLRVNNGASLQLVSSFNNQATLTNSGTGSLTRFTIVGDVLLTGGGSISMGNQVNNRLDSLATLDRLTNVDNTIHGGGQIGVNLMSFTNQGLMDANLPAVTMLLDPPTSGDFTNDAMMRASNGGILSLAAGLYDNTLGVIEAADGSQIEFVSGAHVSGGEITTSGSGFARSVSGNTDMTNVTNTGDLRMNNGTNIILHQALHNVATVTVGGTGALTRLIMAGNVVLDGGGDIVLNPHLNSRIDSLVTLDRLTNVDNTITGGGQIGLNAMSCTNQGVIEANHATVQIVIDPPTSGDFQNEGSLIVSGAAGMSISAGPFTTSGIVDVQAGTKLTRGQDYVQTAGTTIANGELEVNSGNANFSGGVLKGSGLVDANVNNTGGSAEPGESIGLLSVEGSYTQSIAGSLTIEIENVGSAGTDYDQLAVSGAAMLGGTLRLESFGGYVPQVGDTFTVLTASIVAGRFNAVIPCGTYEVTYNPTNVVVEVVGGPPVPGDVSCDGDADLQDLGFLCLQLGLVDTDPEFNPQADLDGDGDVDYADRALIEGIIPPCLGDIVASATFLPPADLQVDGADLAYLLGQWGPGMSCADLVTSATFQPPPDGKVDGADLAVLLGAWGSCP